ncbi:MAG: KEOPS complex subunit Pcc1 [Thermoplasmata archaeon]
MPARVGPEEGEVEVTVVARRACASAAEAGRLRAALAADNPSFVRVNIEGSDLVVRLTATSAASARASLDDLLACLAVAEKAASPPG